MPLHLPSFTRRQFIVRTVQGGVAVLLARPLFAAPAAEERWALLSDTHVAADPTTVLRDVNMTDHLRSAVAAVLALDPAPRQVLVNGDCAMKEGLPGDYAQFVGLLAPLREKGLAVHCTLGNHDDREVFWQNVPDQGAGARPVVGRQLSIIEGPLANWFLLDSLDVTNKTPGMLGDEQRHWLGAALDARAGKPALVMVHHDPMLHPKPGAKPTGLLDIAELMAVLKPRRQVKALFYGHTHTWRVNQDDGIHLVNLPAVAYNFAPGEVTGWIDARLRADGMTLEVHAQNPDPRAQEPVHPQNGERKELAWRG